MSETMSANHLDSTLETLKHEIKNHSTSAAPASISSWITALSGNAALKPIADNLSKLKTAISEKNGAHIVSLMETLGTDTTKSAEKAEAKDKAKILALGKLLTESAKTISTLVKR